MRKENEEKNKLIGVVVVGAENGEIETSILQGWCTVEVIIQPLEHHSSRQWHQLFLSICVQKASQKITISKNQESLTLECRVND